MMTWQDPKAGKGSAMRDGQIGAEALTEGRGWDGGHGRLRAVEDPVRAGFPMGRVLWESGARMHVPEFGRRT